MVKTILVENKYGKGHAIMLHQSELMEDEAKLAATMIEKWGMVAATDDGEDSSGRQRLCLLTPEELIDRAFQTARLFMDYARKNHLVHNSVDPAPEDE